MWAKTGEQTLLSPPPQALLASESLIPVLGGKDNGQGSSTLRVRGGTGGCWDVGLGGGSQEREERKAQKSQTPPDTKGNLAGKLFCLIHSLFQRPSIKRVYRSIGTLSFFEKQIQPCHLPSTHRSGGQLCL